MPVSKDFEKMRLTALGQAAADVLLIPELRLTDRGLVDVNAFDLVDLWER